MLAIRFEPRNFQYYPSRRFAGKSFKWYLENVYPESPIPANYLSLGQVQNEGSKLCLDTMGKKAGQSPGLSGCHGVSARAMLTRNSLFTVE